MTLVLLFFFIFAIFTNSYPPKKPNYYYGYQGWNAKKSLHHWKIANKYASRYMMVVFAILALISFGFDYFEYDADILIAVLTFAGFFTIHIGTERKLKELGN